MTSIELADDDGGSTRTAAVGDTLTLALAETPTSGFRWAVESFDPAVLERLGDEFQPPEAGRLGGSGRRRWTFRVVGVGATTIRLALRRPWEGPPVSSFAATIDVPS